MLITKLICLNVYSSYNTESSQIYLVILGKYKMKAWNENEANIVCNLC